MILVGEESKEVVFQNEAALNGLKLRKNAETVQGDNSFTVTEITDRTKNLYAPIDMEKLSITTVIDVYAIKKEIVANKNYQSIEDMIT